MSAKVIPQRSARRTCGRSPGVSGFRQVRGIFFIGEKFEARLIDDRFFGGKRAVDFVFGGEPLGDDLAGFDVRLVEGVDTDAVCQSAEIGQLIRLPRRRAHSVRSSFKSCRKSGAVALTLGADIVAKVQNCQVIIFSP